MDMSKSNNYRNAKSTAASSVIQYPLARAKLTTCKCNWIAKIANCDKASIVAKKGSAKS